MLSQRHVCYDREIIVNLGATSGWPQHPRPTGEDVWWAQQGSNPRSPDALGRVPPFLDFPREAGHLR
jgi:hypothetical protein